MEDVRLVGRVQKLLHEVVDRRLVGEVGELDLQLFAQRRDVVQRTARGGAHEGMHIRTERDERLGEVGAHETVRARDEARTAGEEVAEVPPQISDGVIRPGGVLFVCFHAAVPADEQPKGSPERGRSAVRSGAFTGLSYVALSLAAAVAGAFLAHKFGRNEKTDGFMAAYGVYLVLVLGAQAFRMVVVPDLTRAEEEGRLGAEFRAYCLAFLVVAIPATVFTAVFAGFFGELVTGRLPHVSAVVAADALPWLIPAAFLQLLAALAASALAARNSYAPPALGFALGGVAGLVFFLIAADSHGIVSLAWGLTLNGVVAIGLPAVVLLLRGSRVRRHRGVPLRMRYRLWQLLYGAAVPLAVQGLYLIALRFAAGTGAGNVTSLSYAYLLAGMFTSATAFSLSLIATAPLTRRGVDAESAATHVVNSAWVSLAFVGAAAGLVALVGGRVVTALLGNAYAGDVGDELGRLVVYLSPWMVASAAFSITYPLM